MRGNMGAAREAAFFKEAWSVGGGRPDAMHSPSPPPLHILMVSDFFYPSTGGVESHMYCLAQCLIARGHRVTVATHCHGAPARRTTGPNGMRVIYLPRAPAALCATLPTLLPSLPLLRRLLLLERPSVVHCHQAFSSLAHEAARAASLLRLPCVFTDHSLFGFADAASILMNKALKFALTAPDLLVCVSHTSKENTVLRACLPPARVAVIPNAVDCQVFRPLPGTERRSVTVVALSRLVYRKGIDLLAAVIPLVCRLRPEVRFVVGGDGPKRRLLAAAVRAGGLEDRVEFLGAVPPAAVPRVLARGAVFLNCSLTEAFCIALVEAAAAGLVVVSTNVGGVPEVLPPDLALLADPDPDSLVRAVLAALARARTLDPRAQHARVRELYSWARVAARTEAVYRRALEEPRPDRVEQLRRARRCGPWFGLLCCCLLAVLWAAAWALDRLDGGRRRERRQASNEEPELGKSGAGR